MTEPGMKIESGSVFTGTSKVARNFDHDAPLHSDDAAKEAGFKGGLILNEYHFTQISEMLIALFGHDWLKHGEIEIKYLSPLYDGDTFTPKARFVGIAEQDSDRCELDVWCENQDGAVLAQGSASCLTASLTGWS